MSLDFNLEHLLRENIKKLIPYSSARSEFKGKTGIFLDANENAFGSPIEDLQNRYPDPYQLDLKQAVSKIKGVPSQNIFIGNGSDEAIDLLIRAFCNPGKDNIIICPPTYGMYEVSASINDVETRQAVLTPNFQLNLDLIAELSDENTKLMFVCSPNNPTGNSIERTDIEILLNNFEGLVIVDEAYINYSKNRGFISELTEYPNLVVLQTLSKAWGLASLRLGLAFAGEPIIQVLNKIKPPYNINGVSQKLALQALQQVNKVNEWTKSIVTEREIVSTQLRQFAFVKQVFPSDANFILVRVENVLELYHYLISHNFIVRDRSKQVLCENTLRITVGTPDENHKLIEVLTQFK